MKTITQPNEKVIAIIKTNHPEAEELRQATWTVPYSKGGIHLLKNIFSGEVVQLDDGEFAAPEKLPELAQRRFYVPKDYDEAEKYLETVKLIKLMQPEKTGLSSYTILPTTGCNARCTYCYEEGYAVKTMTPETVDRLIDFICETRQDDKISLSWFGGEPTLGAKTISRICRELESRGVPFTSRMITNASLITKSLAAEMKEVWHLKRVQVSLDGNRRDYMARKQYIDPIRHNYDVVMRAIHYLAAEDIKVNLRVNFDNRNVDTLRPFLDEMKAEFGENDNVKLYLSILYQEKEQPYYLDLNRQMMELNRYIDSLGINSVEREKRHTSFRLNCCMADNLGKSVVIDPEGRFFDCEHLPTGHSWGNIFDGVTDKALFEKLCAPHEIDEGCRRCPFLPMCTPFYRHGCVGWCSSCREHVMLKTEHALEKLADRLAER